MGFAGFLVLAAALAWLWRRVEALERTVASLRQAAAPGEPEPASLCEIAPEPAPVMAPPPVSADATRRAFSFDFEDLFGRLLPVWAGGVTLAVAGLFVVRWSIERGLLTPHVRVLLAGLFGIGLLAGAELAFRWRERIADPRVAQALAGAGLATLYAAFYLAGSTYGLIVPALAFVGLAAVTAAAIGLSYRFGFPSAVLGLVGGFAAPALVGSEQANLPLLTLYLGLVVSGLSYTGRRQQRGWLGLAALGGGLGWGALLVAQGPSAMPDVAVLGTYLALLGGVMPALAARSTKPDWWLRAAAAGIAALQLAGLVSLGGFGLLAWGLYLLLGAALAWFGWRAPAMGPGGTIAAAVGVLLLAFWPTPGPVRFALVAGALAAIFAGVPLARLRRGDAREIDVAQACGVALGVAGALFWHFATPLPGTPQPVHAFAFALLATIAASAAAWSRAIRGWTTGAEAVAVLLGFAALAQLLPNNSLAWLAAIFAAGIAWRSGTLTGALGMLVALALAWAVEPAYAWGVAGAEALVGRPMLLSKLPTVSAAVLHLAPGPAAALAWRIFAPPPARLRGVLETIALAGATISLHVLYRDGFAWVAEGDFVATGVLERALWEGLLVAAGWLALVRGWRAAAWTLDALALLHFGWFSLVLHNPLWSAQAVGALPIANALLVLYAAGFAALWLASRAIPHEPPWIRWFHHGAVVASCALLVLSELRQLFAGSLLAATSVGQAEDLLRSLAGIVLAAGFLVWGARTGSRSWRIASLVLMVGAVIKVFLVDAAGLEGLARIASFMALGFSLIGIGWFYNRQLRGRG